ncbi:MAG: DUF4873 domain-containing protein [Hamadaea sp.]|nr:DUF4873 domain-containing protein [Hamadaea sp.]
MSYDGPALVGDLAVTVHLAGRWEPVDGRFHWGGRIEPIPAVAALVRAGRRETLLRIGDQQAPARLAEVDPWGGVRVTGVGAPPWPPDDDLEQKLTP